jgi:hypothetical protein
VNYVNLRYVLKFVIAKPDIVFIVHVIHTKILNVINVFFLLHLIIYTDVPDGGKIKYLKKKCPILL